MIANLDPNFDPVHQPVQIHCLDSGVDRFRFGLDHVILPLVVAIFAADVLLFVPRHIGCAFELNGGL